ncbi:hypothetical protein BN136_559 [Cronobacter universalis NCTC 9529]|nr:hypothetical protein BN136_559 [Cronobacter universalis NCTC 9529]
MQKRESRLLFFMFIVKMKKALKAILMDRDDKRAFYIAR